MIFNDGNDTIVSTSLLHKASRRFWLPKKNALIIYYIFKKNEFAKKNYTAATIDYLK